MPLPPGNFEVPLSDTDRGISKSLIEKTPRPPKDLQEGGERLNEQPKTPVPLFLFGSIESVGLVTQGALSAANKDAIRLFNELTSEEGPKETPSHDQQPFQPEIEFDTMSKVVGAERYREMADQTNRFLQEKQGEDEDLSLRGFYSDADLASLFPKAEEEAFGTDAAGKIDPKRLQRLLDELWQPLRYEPEGQPSFDRITRSSHGNRITETEFYRLRQTKPDSTDNRQPLGMQFWQPLREGYDGQINLPNGVLLREGGHLRFKTYDEAYGIHHLNTDTWNTLLGDNNIFAVDSRLPAYQQPGTPEYIIRQAQGGNHYDRDKLNWALQEMHRRKESWYEETMIPARNDAQTELRRHEFTDVQIEDIRPASPEDPLSSEGLRNSVGAFFNLELPPATYQQAEKNAEQDPQTIGTMLRRLNEHSPQAVIDTMSYLIQQGKEGYVMADTIARMVRGIDEQYRCPKDPRIRKLINRKLGEILHSWRSIVPKEQDIPKGFRILLDFPITPEAIRAAFEAPRPHYSPRFADIFAQFSDEDRTRLTKAFRKQGLTAATIAAVTLQVARGDFSHVKPHYLTQPKESQQEVSVERAAETAAPADKPQESPENTNNRVNTFLERDAGIKRTIESNLTPTNIEELTRNIRAVLPEVKIWKQTDIPYYNVHYAVEPKTIQAVADYVLAKEVRESDSLQPGDVRILTQNEVAYLKQQMQRGVKDEELQEITRLLLREKVNEGNFQNRRASI